jgi:hypothetical protein
MQHHAEDDQMPPFTFTILKSFKDCLSRQVAEVIRIHYSKDFILNSKNEYNSNHLSRVVVEEDAFIKKKRARQEELEEVMEKRKWEKLKAEQSRKPKRKPEEARWDPSNWQEKRKLRRMESLEEEYEMHEWWEWAEERCMRAGRMRARLEHDRRRVLWRMENRD